MPPVLRRVLPAVLALLCLAAPLPASAHPAGLTVTGWALSSSPDAVVRKSAAGLTTLAVDGLLLRADGSGVALPPRSDPARLAGVGRAEGLRTELLVSNYSNRLGDFDRTALHDLLASPAHRRRVAAEVAGRIRRGGYDGVNVDFELVRRRDAAGLVAFVRALQAALPGADTVSIDVSPATSVGGYRARGYQIGRLGAAADTIDLMTYDDHGPTWSAAGPIGPLAWQRAAMTALLAEVPARKAQLGFGGYGYTWPASGTGHTVTDARARHLVATDGAVATWNREAGEWTARLSDGTVLWWADARSYRLRVRLARSLGISGLAVWRLGSVDPLAGPPADPT